MRQPEMKITTIPTSHLDPEDRQLIREAGEGILQVVFEEDGVPLAVVVPFSSTQQPEIDRDNFFETFVRSAERSDLPADEAEMIALEAVAAVRKCTDQ